MSAALLWLGAPLALAAFVWGLRGRYRRRANVLRLSTEEAAATRRARPVVDRADRDLVNAGRHALQRLDELQRLRARQSRLVAARSAQLANRSRRARSRR